MGDTCILGAAVILVLLLPAIRHLVLGLALPLFPHGFDSGRSEMCSTEDLVMGSRPALVGSVAAKRKCCFPLRIFAKYFFSEHRCFLEEGTGFDSLELHVGPM